VFSLVVDQIYGMKDLHHLMCIHSGTYLGDNIQTPVYEFTQSPVVVDGTSPRTAANIELKPGYAKSILKVYSYQAYLEYIVHRRPYVPVLCPSLGLIRKLLIGNFPDFADLSRVEMQREGKLTTGHICPP
jgi:hypothetical protein